MTQTSVPRALRATTQGRGASAKQKCGKRQTQCGRGKAKHFLREERICFAPTDFSKRRDSDFRRAGGAGGMRGGFFFDFWRHGQFPKVIKFVLSYFFTPQLNSLSDKKNQTTATMPTTASCSSDTFLTISTGRAPTTSDGIRKVKTRRVAP